MSVARLLDRVGAPFLHLRPDPSTLAGDTYDAERVLTEQGTVQAFVEVTTGSESLGGGQSVTRVRIICSVADVQHYDVLRDIDSGTDYEVLWVSPRGRGVAECVMVEAQAVVGTP